MTEVKVGDRIRAVRTHGPMSGVARPPVLDGVVRDILELPYMAGVKLIRIEGMPGSISMHEWDIEILEPAKPKFEDGLYIYRSRSEETADAVVFVHRAGNWKTYGGSIVPQWILSNIESGKLDLVRLVPEVTE